MEIAGEPSSEIELVQRVSAQCESFDTKNYVSTEDDNDANNLTHETRNNKAMDSLNSDYDDVIESKQTQRPIYTNTDGVNHSCQVRNNTYVAAIDNTNLNQENQETSLRRKAAKYSNEIEFVKPGNAQYRNIGNPHFVSMEDYNDANNITQQTRTIAAMKITNLHHSDINQSNQTQEPIRTYTNNFNHECQVQNHTYVVPADNTNLNQQTSQIPVSRQT